MFPNYSFVINSVRNGYEYPPLAQRLERTPYKRVMIVRLYHGGPICWSDGIGRHTGLKIQWVIP